MRRTTTIRGTCALISFLCLAQCLAAQATPERHVTGTVLDSAGRPLGGVLVAAHLLGDTVSKAALTDSLGRFSLPWSDSAAVLTAKRVGYIPTSPYIPSRSESPDAVRVIRLNAVPVETPSTLAAVHVRGHRVPGEQRIISPGERRSAEFAFGLDQQPVTPGDLAAMAALTPGVLSISNADGTPAGISIAGQPTTANHTTLDGSSYGNADIPPEALASSGIETNAYDPSFGQFTGGEISGTTRGGTDVWAGVLHLTEAPSLLAYGHNQLPGLSQNVNRSQVGVGGGGYIIPQRLYFYGAADASRRSKPASFLDAGSDAVGQIGLPADLGQRVAAIADSLGIVGKRHIPANANVDATSALTRLDYALGDDHLITLRLDEHSAQSSAIGASPFTLGASSGTLRSLDAGVLASVSSHWTGVYNDLHIFNDWTDRHVLQGTPGPSGAIEIPPTASSAGLVTLRVGGYPLGFASSGHRFTEISDQISAAPGTTRHEWKIGALFNRDAISFHGVGDNLGIFTFASLDDFAARKPTAFTRSLIANESAGVAYGALYAGDAWQATPETQILVGARAERSWYPGVADTRPFDGVAASTAPHSEQVILPRLGFSYYSTDGRLTVRGGVGEFRGGLRASSLASAFSQRGNFLSLECIGASAPVPDWARYASDPATVPTTCSQREGEGEGGGGGLSQEPPVTLFAPDFGAARAARASIDVDWQKGNLVFLKFKATLSRGYNEALAFDRNLDTTAKFTLPAEGNRPVYVNSNAIDPLTGGSPLTASRINPAVGNVREITGGGRSSAVQLTFGGSAFLQRIGSVLDLSYTFTRSDVLSTGIDAIGGSVLQTTAGNPENTETGPVGFEVRHAFQVNILKQFTRRLNVTLIGRLTSGVPFTPVVSGDINGDGLSNDRAFIFDPAATRDTALATGMARLIHSAQPSIRSCLQSQRGKVAGSGSCHTGWTPWLDVQTNYGPLNWGDHQVTFIATAQNVTAGLDYLLHGHNGLHGWGQYPFADNTLLRVRGFDPATQGFRYDVNQSFGRVGSINGIWSPVVFSVQARITVGADPARQVLANVTAQLRNRRRSPEEARKWLRTRFLNVPAVVLAYNSKLSLGLTAGQTRELRVTSDSLTPALDSVTEALTPAITAESGMQASPPLVKLVATTDSLIDRSRERVREILTDSQWLKLPPAIRKSGTGGLLPPTRVFIPNP